jgi:hypothetical protein
MAVAEVEPEQVGIGLEVELSAVAPRTRTVPPDVLVLSCPACSCPPFLYGAEGDAAQVGDFTINQPEG